MKMIKFLGKRWLQFEKESFLKKNLSRKSKREISAENTRSFLCIQMNSIGDAIMTQPAWTTLKSSLPEATIDLICRPHVAPLFGQDNSINSIFAFENRKYRSWLLGDIHKLERIWLERNYDILIDFTALPLTAAICSREQAPPSIGFQRTVNISNNRINIALGYDRAYPYSDEGPVRDLMLNLVSPWAKIGARKPKPSLTLTDECIRKTHDLLNDRELGENEFVVLHPGGKWLPRRWPIPYWRKLIEIVEERLNFRLLVLGGLGDDEFIRNICEGLGKYRQRFYISDDICVSSAIIKKAAFCVCNDSAAMHIAAAVGTDSVSMFGPGSPSRTAPPREEGCEVLYANMFCSPCVQYYSTERCKRGINFCMYAIKPEMVFDKIAQILSQIVS